MEFRIIKTGDGGIRQETEIPEEEYRVLEKRLHEEGFKDVHEFMKVFIHGKYPENSIEFKKKYK